MNTEKKKIRTSQGIKEYTYLGCPLTRNRSAWCFRLCIPDEGGKGRCGRIAPHSFKSRIQLGIEKHNKELYEAHLKKLERMYLTDACNEYYEPGIEISEGAAEIVIFVRDELLNASGSVPESVCFKALVDSAKFAVNSLVENTLVMTSDFTIQLAGPVNAGELRARGHFMNPAENQYLAESVLTDQEGKEIGRGHGSFVAGKIPLSSEIGYG